MDIELFNSFEEKLTPEILLAIAEIQQPRSQFQLERFVVNQHDTKEMQYFQCLLEIQSLYYAIRQTNIAIKKTEIEIARLRATGDEIDELDAQSKELGLEQTKLTAIGAFRELEHLTNIYNSFDKKYTRAEIEQLQPDYWNKRLNRQMLLEVAGGAPAASSHLESLRQIGAISVENNEIKIIDQTTLVPVIN